MKPLVASFVIFVAVIFGVFLYFGQSLLAVSWLGFASINAIVLRKLLVAPTYFEKLVMQFLEKSGPSVSKESLLEHFQAQTPNLKPREVDIVFARTLDQLEQRGMIRVSGDSINRRPRQR
jgi:hypothetical protein